MCMKKDTEKGVIYRAMSPSGKFYVGKTIEELKERKRKHAQVIGTDKEVCFSQAIKKYGLDGLKWKVIDTYNTHQEGCEKEIYWISVYGAFSKKRKYGYNLTSGGEGGKHSKETRKKLSKSMRTTSQNPKYKAKQKARAKKMYEDNPDLRNIRSKHSTERWADPDKAEQMRQAMVEASARPEVRTKRINHIKSMWQKQEHKDHFHEVTSGENHHSSVWVAMYDLDGKYIEKYGSIRKAAKITGIHINNIIRVCQDQKGSAGGYQWRYASDMGGSQDIEPYIKRYGKDHHNARPVQQFTKKGHVLIKQWGSINDVARFFGVNHSAISNVCKGKTPSSCGYFWEYANQSIQR